MREEEPLRGGQEGGARKTFDKRIIWAVHHATADILVGLYDIISCQNVFDSRGSRVGGAAAQWVQSLLEQQTEGALQQTERVCYFFSSSFFLNSCFPASAPELQYVPADQTWDLLVIARGGRLCSGTDDTALGLL